MMSAAEIYTLLLTVEILILQDRLGPGGSNFDTLTASKFAHLRELHAEIEAPDVADVLDDINLKLIALRDA